MSADYQQQAELEAERHALCHTIAKRAYFAFLDGYFTAEEFKHLLYELNQGDSQWQKLVK